MHWTADLWTWNLRKRSALVFGGLTDVLLLTVSITYPTSVRILYLGLVSLDTKVSLRQISFTNL